MWVALLVVSPRLHRGKLGGGHSSSQGGHFRRLKCYHAMSFESCSRRSLSRGHWNPREGAEGLTITGGPYSPPPGRRGRDDKNRRIRLLASPCDMCYTPFAPEESQRTSGTS